MYGLGGCDFRQLGCHCLCKAFVKSRIVIVDTPKWHHRHIFIDWNGMQLALYPAGDPSALEAYDQSKDEYQESHDRNTQSAVAGAGCYRRVEHFQIAQHLAR